MEIVWAVVIALIALYALIFLADLLIALYANWKYESLSRKR